MGKALKQVKTALSANAQRKRAGLIPERQQPYRVRWEIDLDADSAHAAATEALAIQRDSESIATVFDVREPNGNHLTIDLRSYSPIPVAACVAQARAGLIPDSDWDQLEKQLEECTCAERSWFGPYHDTACKFTGQPIPNALLRRERPKLNDEAESEGLDRAVTVAERALFPLLRRHSPEEVIDRFLRHIRTHMAVELAFIKTGNAAKYDGETDGPSSTLQLRKEFVDSKPRRKRGGK